MPRSVVVTCLLLFACSGLALPAASSWVPASRDQVIGRAGAPPPTPAASLQRALDQARALLARGYRDDDPRHYGRAEALLAPWLSTDANADLHALQATLLQRRHQFSAAREHLQQALQQEPYHANALLTQALVLRASGELAAARRSCQQLRPLTETLVTLVCEVASAADMSTRTPTYRALTYLLDTQPARDPLVNQWAHRMAASAALDRGQWSRAEHWLQRALALTPEAPRVQIQWLDFLLQRQRLAEAERYLHELDSRHPGVLLRRALVCQRRGCDDWRDQLRQLQQAQVLLQRRGDGDLHLRELTRQVLELEHDPERALPLAQANWRLQREVSDARLLLQAALQAGQPQAAAPVAEWVASEGVRHVRLQALLRQLESRP